MADSHDLIDNMVIEIQECPKVSFPAPTDCNSPSWWSGGELYILNSTGSLPIRSRGQDIESMGNSAPIAYTSYRDGGRWIESVHQDADGVLFGWYHNEPAHFVPEEMQVGRQWPLTAPFIGALVSYDNGKSWDDLGLVLTAGEDSLNLENHNFFFAGGNGDFSVILDRKGEYFYFLFGTYYKDVNQQGISLARMHFVDRYCPVGKVMKWHNGAWDEPGLGGEATPIIPVGADWYSPEPDAFWGPSVHWNQALQQYVILMNRAIDPMWKQEGIYVSLTPDLSDPGSWTRPVRILTESGWYPQVIGEDVSNQETDRVAGKTARLFIHGESRFRIRFSRRDFK